LSSDDYYAVGREPNGMFRARWRAQSDDSVLDRRDPPGGNDSPEFFTAAEARVWAEDHGSEYGTYLDPDFGGPTIFFREKVPTEDGRSFAYLDVEHNVDTRSTDEQIDRAVSRVIQKYIAFRAASKPADYTWGDPGEITREFMRAQAKPAQLEQLELPLGLQDVSPILANNPDILESFRRAEAEEAVQLDPSDPFDRVLIDVVRTNRAKRQDYVTAGASVFENFDRVDDQVGLPHGTALEALIAVKQARLRALRGNDRGPANEPIRDTLLDRAVYSVLALAYHDEQKKQDGR